MKTLFTTLCLACLITHSIAADEILLEDYEGKGKFSMADWANSFEDAKGRTNSADKKGGVAVVKWGSKWSGLPSTGERLDLSKHMSFQVDVMVSRGQPVQAESNYYFQLLDDVDSGYAYWEAFIPQTKVPADGKWYRITFPIKIMEPGFGDGAEKPDGRTKINGCCCGMTFDENGDKFDYKQVQFDNVTVTTKEVDGIKVTLRPNPKKKQ